MISGELLGLFRDLLHGVDELVELFFRLALGRLDHQRAGNNQREADRVRMETVVDQPLGDVAGLDALASPACWSLNTTSCIVGVS